MLRLRYVRDIYYINIRYYISCVCFVDVYDDIQVVYVKRIFQQKWFHVDKDNKARMVNGLDSMISQNTHTLFYTIKQALITTESQKCLYFS